MMGATEPEPKRTVIRAGAAAHRVPEEEPSSPRRKTPASPGLAAGVLGGALASFGPLFPWWRETMGGIELGKIGGLQAWPGQVCLAGGIAILVVAIVLTSKPHAPGRFGEVILAAGGVVTGAAIIAVFAGRSITGSFTEIGPEVGIYLTLPGGALAVVGGYLHRREGRAR